MKTYKNEQKLLKQIKTYKNGRKPKKNDENV